VPETIQEASLSPFTPADQDEARSLILSGLAEHWAKLDPTLNPDLIDIAASYDGAYFLVARQYGRLVGTGALVPRSSSEAEIVRMSVARDLRRQGLGRLLLEALVEQARCAGFRRLILETTSAWEEVIAFYLCFGFKITHHRDGDTFFALDLD
jgi:putative acetyltransferase